MSDQMSIDAEALVRAAKAGDKDAMYRLASIFSAEGHKDLAIEWLKKAASNGHGDARFTLANYYLRGINVDRNVAHAVTILEVGVKHWHMPSVQLYAALLAQGVGVDKNWQQAVALTVLAVTKAHSPSMVELAFLLMMAGDDHADLAHRLMQAAACRKNLHAGLYIASCYDPSRELIDKKIASYWVARALEMGHPKAKDFSHLAGESVEPQASWVDIPPLDLKDIQTRLTTLSVWIPSDAKMVSDRPKVQKVSHAIPPKVCDYIMALSMPLMRPAQHYDPVSSEWLPHSQCKGRITTFWPEDHNLISYVVYDRMIKAAQTGPDFVENLNILAFERGDEYLPHIDFIPPDDPSADDLMAMGGQSVATLHLTLNVAQKGGKTCSGPSAESLDLQQGDICIFTHILADGQIDDQAMMAETFVEDGEHWTATCIVREKVVDFD